MFPVSMEQEGKLFPTLSCWNFQEFNQEQTDDNFIFKGLKVKTALKKEEEENSQLPQRSTPCKTHT